MAKKDEEALWVITDHVCRFCFGRVLRSQDGALVRCADCSAQVKNKKVTELCACGQEYKTGGPVALKCKKNPEHIVGIGQEVMVEHG